MGSDATADGQQRCALVKAQQRLPALRGELPGDLGATRGDRDRIALQRASMRRNIMLKGPEIRRMSDQIGFPPVLMVAE